MSLSTSESDRQRPPIEAYVAIGTVSFAVLAAEIALTRVFSVLFRAPYVFLVVSGAIGGLGLGGVLIQWVRPRAGREQGWMAGLMSAFAAALVLPLVLLFATPWGQQVVGTAETALVVFLPMVAFALGGAILALILRTYARESGGLYAVDLACAAAAAPASVLLLDGVGALNVPLGLGAVSGGAAALVAFRSRHLPALSLAVMTCLVSMGLLGSNLTTHWLDLPVLRAPAAAMQDPAHPWHLQTKPLYAELATAGGRSRIARTDWTAVSRTDVVREETGPGNELFYIYTDGDVPTQMDKWDGSLEKSAQENGSFIGTLSYRMLGRRPQSVMAIGAGGGLDVLLAKVAGATQIDAVEINPSIPRIVTDPRFQSTYARVYKEPGVRLIVDEGRSFLHRAGQYDLIYFACAKTATTQTSGTALLDNHLYTVEAFRDYWRHLTEGGIAALVTQEPAMIDRLLLTALQALAAEGVDPATASACVMTARVPLQLQMYGPYRHILLLRRGAWKEEDRKGMLAACRDNVLEPLYVPHGVALGAMGNPVRYGSTLADLRTALERQYPVPGGELANLAAVTDDNPFYADLARGLHPTLKQLLEFSLMAVVAVLLLGALAARSGRRGASQERVPLMTGLLFFSALGAGFILVELVLLQRLNLVLGYPTRSLTVGLFGLLLGSAAGAATVGRGSSQAAFRRARVGLLLLLVLLGGYLVFLPGLSHTLLGLALPLRIAAVLVLIVPPGFLMGMALPTSLRTLPRAALDLVPTWWSINGAATILGSVGTVALAKFFGYTGALVCGMICYGVAWLIFPRSTDQDAEGSTSDPVPAASV